MATHWNLKIDLFANDTDLTVRGTLTEPNGQRAHRAMGVDIDDYEALLKSVRAAFAPTGVADRLSEMQGAGELAAICTDLHKLLSQLEPDDTVVISTTVTSVPWDLLVMAGYPPRFLGLVHPVGLDLPLDRESKLGQRVADGSPHFLHVIADPEGNLPHCIEEQQALKAIVAGVPGLSYEPIFPTKPSELKTRLRHARRTPFVHFSGHIDAERGLRIGKGTTKRDYVSPEAIRSHLLSAGDEIVFLNGCDGQLHTIDLRTALNGAFQLTTVANAFLDAGAAAVIAPRSSISDVEAVDATKGIWPRLLRGAALGEVVRDFRRDRASHQPNGLAAWSYVLYGQPRYRAAMKLTASAVGTRVIAKVQAHPVVVEASTLTSGQIAPRHLLWVLSRSWSVGQTYLRRRRGDPDEVAYVDDLIELRGRLAPEDRPARPSKALLPETLSVLARASVRAGARPVDEVDLLLALSDAEDADLDRLLRADGRGPTMRQLAVSARTWSNDGRLEPQTLVLPSSLVNRRAFLPDLPRLPTDAPVRDPTELLVAIVNAGGHVSKAWDDLALPRPTRKLGLEGLDWFGLGDDTRHVLRRAWGAAQRERRRTIDETRLVKPLLETINAGPVDAWAASLGKTTRWWKRASPKLTMLCIGWSLTVEDGS